MAAEQNEENKRENEKEKEETPVGFSEIPAIYCDGYYLNIWPEYMRISFGK
jgi:hypothetical protein